MSETTTQDLSGVSETLLLTLYIRALKSQRPDALLNDKKAVAWSRGSTKTGSMISAG